MKAAQAGRSFSSHLSQVLSGLSEFAATIAIRQELERGPREQGWGAMARYEMPSADMAAMVPAQAAPEAFFELGLMYASGRSVPTDLVAAHKWLNIALVRGFRPAAERRAELAQEMTAAEVAQAQREARLWLTRH